MAVVDTSTDVTGIGRTIEVEVGAMAHGGHCVARHEGRVVFVRHAVPGEKVRVALTEAEDGARFWRGDVVEVLRPSEFRRIHQWKLADMLRAHASGRPPVGGAEFGHIVSRTSAGSRPRSSGTRCTASPTSRWSRRCASPAPRTSPPASAGGPGTRSR